MSLARQVTVDTTSFDQDIDQAFKDLARLRELVGMPRVNLKSRKTRKMRKDSSKNNGLYRTFARGSSYLSQSFDPFPAKMRTVMRYCDDVRLNPGLGNIAYHYIKCNGLFDPNQTGGGHQPYGHDICQLIYNHYRVDKAVMTLSVAQGTTAGAIVGIGITDDTTAAGSINSILEQKGARFAVMTSNPSEPIRIQNTWTRSGVFPNTANNTDTSYGADPTELSFFQIFYRDADTSEDPPALQLFVSVEYYVTSYEMKDLGES